MLVLTRREGETFSLGDDIVIEILDIKSGVVRVGIRAPRSVRVLRSELITAVAAENTAAVVKTSARSSADTSRLVADAAPVTRG